MSDVLASEPKKRPGHRITLRAVYEEVQTFGQPAHRLAKRFGLRLSSAAFRCLDVYASPKAAEDSRSPRRFAT